MPWEIWLFLALGGLVWLMLAAHLWLLERACNRANARAEQARQCLEGLTAWRQRFLDSRGKDSCAKLDPPSSSYAPFSWPGE
jgi:hypothetical protein